MMFFNVRDWRREAHRLASFRNWQVDYIAPADLARAGFFFLPNMDLVKCAFCDLFIHYHGEEEEGDQPMEAHRTLSPDCPFLQGAEVGNVPLEEEEEDAEELDEDDT